MGFHPVALVRIDLRGAGSVAFHRLERLCQRLNVFRDAQDELVVPDIDGAAEQLPALRVGARNDEILRPHQIPLEPRRDQAVDMLADGDEHFAGQMAAFLAPVELVFEMHGRRAVLGEQLGQLHDSRQPSVSGQS